MGLYYYIGYRQRKTRSKGIFSIRISMKITDPSQYPIQSTNNFLSHCSVSTLYQGAADAASRFNQAHLEHGISLFGSWGNPLHAFHRNFGALLETSEDNIAFLQNTSEGICQIANGYPFEPGDEIISYVHEYPANHYPWRLQEQRGVTLTLLSDVDPVGNFAATSPRGWSMDELEQRVSSRTRIIAISHVQFTSAYPADLEQLGEFCASRGIDLIVDAAQSLGCLPIYPERWNIAAIAASGWKWLLGPIGSGVLYTSPALREKVQITMAGAELMKQNTEYLDHTWDPIESGARFEYSTLALSHAVGLDQCIQDIFLPLGIERIAALVKARQNQMLELIDREKYTPLIWPDNRMSSFVSLAMKDQPDRAIVKLRRAGITLTSRVGYLRVTPQCYNSEEQVAEAVEVLNSI